MNQWRSASASAIRPVAYLCLLFSYSVFGEETKEIPGLEIIRTVVNGQPIYICEATFPEDPIYTSSVGVRLKWACYEEAAKEAMKGKAEGMGPFYIPRIGPVSADYHRGILWLRILMIDIKGQKKGPEFNGAPNNLVEQAGYE